MAPAIVILSLIIRINIMLHYRLHLLATPPQSSLLFYLLAEANAKLLAMFHIISGMR